MMVQSESQFSMGHTTHRRRFQKDRLISDVGDHRRPDQARRGLCASERLEQLEQPVVHAVKGRGQQGLRLPEARNRGQTGILGGQSSSWNASKPATECPLPRPWRPRTASSRTAGPAGPAAANNNGGNWAIGQLLSCEQQGTRLTSCASSTSLSSLSLSLASPCFQGSLARRRMAGRCSTRNASMASSPSSFSFSSLPAPALTLALARAVRL